MNNVNEVQHLKALNTYLKPSGRTQLIERPAGQLGLKEYVLRYQTDGQVPVTWPVTGSADFEFIFNEAESKWFCTGNMFGTTPSGHEPKTWLHSIGQGIKSREQVIKGFLHRALGYWERYRGDLDQFTYRLGIEMSATGHMQKTSTGYCWAHTSHPDIKVFFSPDPEKPGYGMLPQFKFGFYEPVKAHVWYLSTDNLSSMSSAVATFSADARKFCEGASACLGLVTE